MMMYVHGRGACMVEVQCRVRQCAHDSYYCISLRTAALLAAAAAAPAACTAAADCAAATSTMHGGHGVAE